MMQFSLYYNFVLFCISWWSFVLFCGKLYFSEDSWENGEDFYNLPQDPYFEGDFSEDEEEGVEVKEEESKKESKEFNEKYVSTQLEKYNEGEILPCSWSDDFKVSFYHSYSGQLKKLSELSLVNVLVPFLSPDKKCLSFKSVGSGSKSVLCFYLSKFNTLCSFLFDSSLFFLILNLCFFNCHYIFHGLLKFYFDYVKSPFNQAKLSSFKSEIVILDKVIPELVVLFNKIMCKYSLLVKSSGSKNLVVLVSSMGIFYNLLAISFALCFSKGSFNFYSFFIVACELKKVLQEFLDVEFKYVNDNVGSDVLVLESFYSNYSVGSLFFKFCNNIFDSFSKHKSLTSFSGNSNFFLNILGTKFNFFVSSGFSETTLSSDICFEVFYYLVDISFVPVDVFVPFSSIKKFKLILVGMKTSVLPVLCFPLVPNYGEGDQYSFLNISDFTDYTVKMHEVKSSPISFSYIVIFKASSKGFKSFSMNTIYSEEKFSTLPFKFYAEVVFFVK